MKKLIAFVLCLVMVFSSALAEEILTADNCQDLATILGLGNSIPFYDVEAINKKFANANTGKTVEFDALVADVIGDDLLDIELYDPSFNFNTIFVLRNVSKMDAANAVDPADAAYFAEDPTYLIGSKIHVIAKVDGFDDESGTGLTVLDPVSIRLADEEPADAAETSNSEDAEPADAAETSSPEVSAIEYPTLEKGSRGDEVKTLQQRLIDLMYLDDKADGIFGNNTKAAVEEFQEAAGLEQTGIADSKTQNALYADDAPKSSPNISCSSVVVGSMAKSVWSIGGKEYTLTNSQTKTVKTRWGTYKIDAFGNIEKLD